MVAMDKASLGRLAFWALNMMLANDGQNNWPGFRYTETEWARLEKLAGAVDRGAFLKYLAIVVVLFLVMAGCAVVGVLLPMMTWLYPNPADLKPLPFVLALASVALLSIGIGLPASMSIAARASTTPAMLAALHEEPGDAALAAKASHQITRMAVIMCGILVPGTMLWIAFDIDSGPITAALKWAAIGLMAASATHTLIRRKH
jgi:hypothetical protein